MELVFHSAVLYSTVLLICCNNEMTSKGLLHNFIAFGGGNGYYIKNPAVNLIHNHWNFNRTIATYYATHLPGIPLSDESLMEPMGDLNRIAGGQNASIEDFAHQVSMNLNNSYFCGGFIINDTWIMTAAHCVAGYSASEIEVKAGSVWRTGGTKIPLKNIKSHPGYFDDGFDYDVAVLETAEPINFTDKIRPIKLPPRNRPMETFSRVNVSGWGRTQEGSPLPDHLMYVEISVMPRMICQMSYGSIFTDNMFCARSMLLEPKGSCPGDSGGPVVQDGVAEGVVAYGQECGHPVWPSVFTSTAAPSIRDFITYHTGL